jgi:sterol 24-C-methyltransferase
MAPIALEKEDHTRDADFNKAMHGKSAGDTGGIKAMMGKNAEAQKAAVSEYFKHWDNKSAEVETDETRKARRDEYATLTRQYVLLSFNWQTNSNPR